jgi:hypothetical protein
LQSVRAHVHGRLRQLCNHPSLLPTAANDSSSLCAAAEPCEVEQDGGMDVRRLVEMLESRLAGGEEECCVCLDDIDPSAAVITKCAHIFCSPCLQVASMQGYAPCCAWPQQDALAAVPPILLTHRSMPGSAVCTWPRVQRALTKGVLAMGGARCVALSCRRTTWWRRLCQHPLSR